MRKNFILKSSGFKWLSVLAIIGLGLIVYSNTFFSSFHFDDDLYIINDYAIRNIQNLFDIWKICPCRFITFLTLAINYHFSGLHVFGYHVFNIAVHLASACLVWYFLRLTLMTPVMIAAVSGEERGKMVGFISLLAGLIFVGHPIQIEAVTYIWQRAASLAAFFYLASLCCYVQSRLLSNLSVGAELVSARSIGRTQDPPLRMILYICSLITAMMAMFTKENSITLPLMIILYEISFFNVKKSVPVQSKSKQKNKMPIPEVKESFISSIKDLDWDYLFPFVIILFIIPETMLLTHSVRFQEIQSIVGGQGGISPWHYLLTQFRVIVTYMRLIILPFNLNLDYDYPVYKSFFEIPVLTSFIFLMTILYSAKRLFTKYRLLSFSILWFFLTLLPESSILPQEDVIFEHRLYLPLVGFCIFLASGLYYLFQKNNIKTAMIVLSVIIAFYAVLTYQRNKIWKDEITLWKDVVQKSPHKARAYNNLGWAFYKKGDLKEAMTDFNKAIAIDPDYLFSYDDRGLIYAKEGRFTEAIDEYNKALKINPNYPMIYFNRGVSYASLNKNVLAMSDLNKAIELDPEYVDAYNMRRKIYISEGNLPQAQSEFERSRHIDPGQASANK